MVFLELNQFYSKMGQEIVVSYLTANKALLAGVHSIFDFSFYVLLYTAIFVSFIFVIMSITAFFSKRRSAEYLFDESNAPFVTIQIPTFNELAALNCASKCLELDYPKGKYEIIIGDDSNNAAVSARIDAFAALHKDVIKVTRRGNNAGFKPGNLNYMLKFSKGEIISILDSDFLPDAEFLRTIVAPFQNDSNVGAVQVRWKFVNQNQNLITILGSVIGLTFHHLYLPFMRLFGKTSFLCGSAEAVRKDLIVGLGGWQDGALTEDIEFSMRLLSNGYGIVYRDDHECGCEVPFVAKDLYRQQMRWAFGVISAFLQHSVGIFFSKELSLKKKIGISLQGLGYFFSTLLVLMFITGTVSFFSNAPAPIDLSKFLLEMGRNIILTSGILITSFAALWKTRNRDLLLKALVSSFTYGLVVTYYVNLGIFKAVAGKKMAWFMLNKNGNNFK